MKLQLNIPHPHMMRRPTIGQLIKRLALSAALVVVGVGAWTGWGVYHNVAKATGNSNPLQLVSTFIPATLKATNGRTNILLAGYSNDDAGHAGADLTDSIMILSIDQSTKSAALISIPRDLYVSIPGYGYSKINAAYAYGESESFNEAGYASGGMGLLEKTIEQTLGVQSNYYALINYTAFKDVVTAVGGVTLTISSSDSNGVYDPNTDLNLPNGVVTLDGQTALNLARARGEGYGSYGFSDGDFTRTQYQQQLLVALKNKLASSSSLSNLTEISSLASALGSNVKTDLQLNEIKTLYSATKDFNDASITDVTLNDFQGQNLIQYYTTELGQSTVIPALGIDDYSQIQASIQQLLSGHSL